MEKHITNDLDDIFFPVITAKNDNFPILQDKSLLLPHDDGDVILAFDEAEVRTWDSSLDDNLATNGEEIIITTMEHHHLT